MFERLSRIAFWLTLLFIFAIVGIMVLPYTDSNLQLFAANPEACDGACFLGIRPNVTTVREAVEILQSHPWIARIERDIGGTGYGAFQWEWSGQQPDWIDGSKPGQMTIYWESRDANAPPLVDVIIQTVWIDTKLRMYMLQNWYGTPDSGVASIHADGTLSYSAAYHFPGSSIHLNTVMACPVDLLSYWEARTRITLSIGPGTSAFVPMGQMVGLC